MQPLPDYLGGPCLELWLAGVEVCNRERDVDLVRADDGAEKPVPSPSPTGSPTVRRSPRRSSKRPLAVPDAPVDRYRELGDRDATGRLPGLRVGELWRVPSDACQARGSIPPHTARSPWGSITTTPRPSSMSWRARDSQCALSDSGLAHDVEVRSRSWPRRQVDDPSGVRPSMDPKTPPLVRRVTPPRQTRAPCRSTFSLYGPGAPMSAQRAVDGGAVFLGVTRPENADCLKTLSTSNHYRDFDTVWWMYFREVEPARPRLPSVTCSGL